MHQFRRAFLDDFAGALDASAADTEKICCLLLRDRFANWRSSVGSLTVPEIGQLPATTARKAIVEAGTCAICATVARAFAETCLAPRGGGVLDLVERETGLKGRVGSGGMLLMSHLGGSSFLSRYLLRRSALLRHGFERSRWCG
jgi:hypothetical protein